CLDALTKLSADQNKAVADAASHSLAAFAQRNTLLQTNGTVKTIKLFLSSPADVTEERQLVHTAVERLNHDGFLSQHARIEVVAYDDPANPLPFIASLSPQEAINQ